jgi:hypothetical protein
MLSVMDLAQHVRFPAPHGRNSSGMSHGRRATLMQMLCHSCQLIEVRAAFGDSVHDGTESHPRTS